MSNIARFILVTITALVLSACKPAGTPAPALQLEITAYPQTYARAGQVITYSYRITNTGTATLGPAQFIIRDDRLGPPFSCGPANITLAPNQNLICSAVYTITQADISRVKLTNKATASGGGQTSAVATATITNQNNPSVSATPTATLAIRTPVGPTATLAVPGTMSMPTSGTPVGPTSDITGVPPLRISFGPGETTAAQIGIVNPKETIVYVVSAVQGQLFTVKLTAPANALAIGVTGPTGLAVKALDENLVWSTSIANAGDYWITIASLVDTSTSYTLEVGLSPALTATPAPVNSPTSPPP